MEFLLQHCSSPVSGFRLFRLLALGLLVVFLSREATAQSFTSSSVAGKGYFVLSADGEGTTLQLSIRLAEGRQLLHLRSLATTSAMPKIQEEQDILFLGKQRRHAPERRNSIAFYDGSELEVWFYSRRGTLHRVTYQTFGSPENQWGYHAATYSRERQIVRLPDCGHQGESSSHLAAATTSRRQAYAAVTSERPPLYQPPLLLELHAEADASYVAATGGKSKVRRRLTRRIRTAGRLYLEQVGIKLLPGIISVSSRGGTSGRRDGSVLIEQFRTRSAKQGRDDGDAHILFTGLDTSLDGDLSVVGAAQVGVVCRFPANTFGFIEKASAAVETVVLAHELGHMLGASHDNFGRSSVMAPRASPSNLRFSDFSLGQIASHVDPNQRCIAVGPLEARWRPEVVDGQFRASVELDNVIDSSCVLEVFSAGSRRRASRRKARSLLVSVPLNGAAVQATVSRSRGELSFTPRNWVAGRVSCGNEAAFLPTVRVG